MPPAKEEGTVGAVVNRRMVQWDPSTGQPIVVTAPMFTPAQIKDIIAAAVTQPYGEDLDDLGIESEFKGMSLMEVMVVKLARRAAASGDRGDVESILDRLIGKSLTRGENVNVKVGYEDYLKELEAKRAPPFIPAATVEEDIFG